MKGIGKGPPIAWFSGHSPSKLPDRVERVWVSAVRRPVLLELLASRRLGCSISNEKALQFELGLRVLTVK